MEMLPHEARWKKKRKKKRFNLEILRPDVDYDLL